MNKTSLVAIAILVLVALGVYFFIRTTPVSAPSPVATSTPVGTTSMNMGGYTVPLSTGSLPHSSGATVTVDARVITVDSASLATNAPYPTITGTANVSPIGIVIFDGQGVGIVGSKSISVLKGHWSYSSPRALPPGTYSIQMLGADTQVTKTLVVK